MFRPGLTFFLTLLLTTWCWLGAIAPVFAQSMPQSMPQPIAQSMPTALTAELSSGGQPLFSFSGKRPTNLGIKDGKLADCPTSPNCVSSQAPTSDQEHAIVPLLYTTDAATAMAALKSIITGLPRTKIITETENYLYAEFTSALMGYVDDVEFYLVPGESTIHVRSASRLGQSDLGVNRKRIEAIRTQLTALK